MRIVLIYPPPWKIADKSSKASFPCGEGPPGGHDETTLGGDFIGPPYGLLQLATQARRAGYLVTPLNLSLFPWSEIKKIVDENPADVWGFSVFTSNRRGAMMMADLVRDRHPSSHIVFGGPHATALSRELLERVPALDTVVLGEGEASFLELCQRIKKGLSTQGIKGTAYRSDTGIQVATPRENPVDLNQLEPLHRHFDTPFLITSRGCPGRCSFCGSRNMWTAGCSSGARLRFTSVDTVLDSLEQIVVNNGQPLVAIKDDTFTANRRRALDICRGIRDRNLKFLWLCDTRVDQLDKALLREMRLAGCQRISLGVESGSPAILKRLRKRIRIDQVRQITRLAKEFGIQVRYYMILGSPGETRETLAASLSLLKEEKPHQVVFSPLSTYPGTAEFDQLLESGSLTLDGYLDDDFWTPIFYHHVSVEARQWIDTFLAENPWIATLSQPKSSELRAALDTLPQSAAAHMDLAVALASEGREKEATQYVAQGLEMGYPLPGIGHNILACLAAAQGNAKAVQIHLTEAAAGYPLRHIMHNVALYEAWLEAGSRNLSQLDLVISPCFDIAEPMQQPMNPGPVE